MFPCNSALVFTLRNHNLVLDLDLGWLVVRGGLVISVERACFGDQGVALLLQFLARAELARVETLAIAAEEQEKKKQVRGRANERREMSGVQ